MIKFTMKNLKTAIPICLVSIFFIVILVQNYYVEKRIDKLQVSMQDDLQKNIKDLSEAFNTNQKELNDKLQVSIQNNIQNFLNLQKDVKDLSEAFNTNQKNSTQAFQVSVENSPAQLKALIEEVKLNSEALLRNAMAEKVEAIIKNKTTTEEKVIAIAHWVSSHIANNREFGNNVYTWFSERAGLCGMRSVLFVEMLKYINVYSQVYNICKFPTCASAHSNARAYYNGSWHYFDVTYAGYFKKDNNILSFEEIIEISKEEDPLKYLIVFEETLDYVRHINPNDNNLHTLPEDKAIKAMKVNNIDRMHQVYSRDNVRNAADYGPYNNGYGFNCAKYCK